MIFEGDRERKYHHWSKISEKIFTSMSMNFHWIWRRRKNLFRMRTKGWRGDTYNYIRWVWMMDFDLRCFLVSFRQFHIRDITNFLFHFSFRTLTYNYGTSFDLWNFLKRLWEGLSEKFSRCVFHALPLRTEKNLLKNWKLTSRLFAESIFKSFLFSITLCWWRKACVRINEPRCLT